MKKVLVIGAGAWGTAIANLIAKNGHRVFLNVNNIKIADEIKQKNQNEKFLPGVILDKKIIAISSYEKDVDLVFVVTPSINSAEVFHKISSAKFKKNCGFVICSKGVEPKSLLLLSDAFEKITGNKNYAVFSGPNFAHEVANEAPSITTIATKNKKLAQSVIDVLNNDYFQAGYFNDPRTAEICGVVKNIIAIGCGIVDELGLGINAKAALVMKGISEIRLLCKKLRACDDVATAAGFGDIFLTCSSGKSRNNSLGRLIAQGKPAEKNKTYEGILAAKAVSAMSQKLKLRLDLCEEINEILTHKFPQKEIRKKIVKAILK
ncbi:MAG: hypothetical protein A2887_03785 [Alphaproteobacteria bacterium RIFCSPLOWO2_01_FULL_40_26]|nr:MAG: hypothetical protein A3D15_04940 [Alphaproteobacteria bacterium RIFCSPHIGHO2_02_FULL_40_34]OFW86473.1 MAG: hypothetical protein A2794_01415 [Alphaproteobacteria bacterium RIFCSPHIGHO2_01_FULL_40_8]OFW95319.1 MAG: hypothetical protein A2887_03785 [Alphaproteobacteria bacterium RIFCSPLOWO2_01_FULL_40_26]OFX09222.1 MAG: hypothetical protein A3H30_06490 [Alphaproteobacteria bacterium RIFCSPLOWO2_02_FULL_40_19]OFX11577.1 MAG: hypothetical protein A3G22_05095 [Alphaproteobacteria bacterium RI